MGMWDRREDTGLSPWIFLNWKFSNFQFIWIQRTEVIKWGGHMSCLSSSHPLSFSNKRILNLLRVAIRPTKRLWFPKLSCSWRWPSFGQKHADKSPWGRTLFRLRDKASCCTNRHKALRCSSPLVPTRTGASPYGWQQAKHKVPSCNLGCTSLYFLVSRKKNKIKTLFMPKIK